MVTTIRVNQLKAGVLLSYATLLTSLVVTLIYTPYMLKMIGQSEFGLYSLVGSIVAYLTIFDGGFGNAIVRYTAQFRALGKIDAQYSMFGMFVILYFVIGLAIGALGLYFYYQVDTLFADSMTDLELDKIRTMILITLFNLVLTLPLSIFGSIITAYERFVFHKTIQIARIVLNAAAMVAILEMGFKAVGMIVVVTIFNVLTLVTHCWYCFVRIKIKLYFYNFQWSLLKGMAIYSFYIFLTIIVDRLFWSTGQFVLGVQVGSASIAIFAVAIQLQAIYMSFSLAISSVFLPKMTALVTGGASQKCMSDLFIRTGRLQFSVMSFILCGFILFGKPFVLIWAGEEYGPVYVITLLFFIPLTVPLIQNLGVTILEARNQMKFRAYLYLVIALFSLILQVKLTYLYGVIGTAISISIALVVGNAIVMNIYYFKKQKLDILRFWREISRMAVSPIIITGTAYLVMQDHSIDNVEELVIWIITFSVAYFCAFWVISLNQNERDLVGRPVKRVLSNWYSKF